MLLFQTEPITWAPTQYHLSVAILSSYYKGCFIAPPVPSSFVRLWLQENVDIRLGDSSRNVCTGKRSSSSHLLF